MFFFILLSSSSSSASLGSRFHVRVDAELFDQFLRRYLIYAADLNRFLSVCPPEYLWIRLAAYRARKKKAPHPFGCVLPRCVLIWGVCRMDTEILAFPATNYVSDEEY